MARWSRGSLPFKAGAITFAMFSIALRTPLPRYRPASPSRSSTASCSPVEAPLGTAAHPTVPSESVTSASTVGFPLESSTSLPCTLSIFATDLISTKVLAAGPSLVSHDVAQLVDRVRLAYHNHAAFGNGVPTRAVLFKVITDLRILRNRNIAINNTSPESAVSSYADSRE